MIALEDRVLRPRRRGADPRVNLASNELRHDAVNGLVSQLLSGLDIHAAHRYPNLERPVEALADMLVREPDEILLTPGSDAAIRLLLSGLHETYGGRCILQEPNYEAWTRSPSSARWAISRIRRGARSNAALATIAGAAAETRRSVVAISWPNGPAGYAPSLEDVAALGRLCADRGHLLVIDACYSGFADGFPAVVELAGPSCLVVVTWSKLFGLAGARAAIVVGGVDHIGALSESGCEHQVSWLALHAFERTRLALPAFQDLWRDIRDEREFLRGQLLDEGHMVAESGGNFLHLGFPSRGAAATFTDEASRRGYRVRDMAATPDLENCVRFTVGCDAASRQFRTSVLPQLLRTSD
jgi:histidinol-phosphate aminotransferase